MSDPTEVDATTDPTAARAVADGAPDVPSPEAPHFEALHATEGYCARLPDGRLCLMFGDGTYCVGVTLVDDEMVCQLHTAIVRHLVRPAGVTLH